MQQPLSTTKRAVLGLAALLWTGLGVALSAMGYALSGVWPGLSWAIGTSLALVCFVVAARIAITAVRGTDTMSRDANSQWRGSV